MADEKGKKESAPPSTNSLHPDDEFGLKGHWKCLAACTLLSFCPFQYGLDFGLIGGMQSMLGFLRVFGYEDPTIPGGWNISTKRQQLISSFMTLGAFITSGLAGPIATVIGRKMTIWLASIICIVSNILMMSSTGIGALYAGRLLIGLANGLFMTFSQLYIQECCPARYRGLMIAAFQIWIMLGSLIGTIVDNFTAKIDGRDAYLIPLGLIYIIPVIVSFGLFLVPESPRWLLQQGRLSDARKALRWLRPYSEAAVDDELKDAQFALETEAAEEKNVAVMDMFSNVVDLRRTIISTLALLIQGASGAMYIIAYGVYFFQMAGIGDPFENACVNIAVGAAALILNTALITKYGRRRVCLMLGLFLCGATQLVIAAVYSANPGSKATLDVLVGLTIAYTFCFNAWIATYSWLSAGELPSQRLRSYTFGLSTAISFFAAWLTTFTAPYFINPESLNWGPKYGYIWAPSCWVAAIWVFFFLPEVKDRTLEEIDEMFEARLSARKFRKYVCVGRTGGTGGFGAQTTASGEDIGTEEGRV